MPFGYGVLGSGDGRAVLIGLLCIEFTVYVVGDGVAVYRECCIKNKVLGRHGFGYIPSGEGMPFGYGVLGSGNCCAVLIGLLCIEFTVYVVGNGIAVYLPGCVNRDILIGDKTILRHSLPACKCIAGFFRRFRKYNYIACIAGEGVILLSVNNERNRMLGYCIGNIDSAVCHIEFNRSLGASEGEIRELFNIYTELKQGTRRDIF